MKDNYLKLQERNESLEKQINDIKIDELKNELTKTKVEYFRTSLDDSHSKLIKEVETIKQLEVNNNEQKEVLKSHIENFNQETDNMHNLISDIIKFFNDNSNKFIGDKTNIIEFFSNYIKNWNNLLSSLNFDQLVAIAHITSSICILINIFAIISILFGDKLIIYFKIEERFPKLTFILKLRQKVNKYSLILSFFIIISILLGLIYANILILLKI
jgi:hypothetical protein